jgi:AcrR family transcriptional regulator
VNGRTAPESDPAASVRAAETAQRRQRILDAACALATEGGYAAVQMRDVASAAEVALGTLYRQYSSKDQLLLAAMAGQATVLRARLGQRPAVGTDPADRVADVLRRASRALARDQQLTAAMVTALSSRESDAVEAKLAVNEILRDIIGGAFDGVELSELDAILRTLGYVWFSVLASWVGGMIDADRMSDDLTSAAHLILDGRT